MDTNYLDGQNMSGEVEERYGILIPLPQMFGTVEMEFKEPDYRVMSAEMRVFGSRLHVQQYLHNLKRSVDDAYRKAAMNDTESLFHHVECARRYIAGARLRKSLIVIGPSEYEALIDLAERAGGYVQDDAMQEALDRWKERHVVE